MMNPGNIMKLMEAKNQFEQTHPKFAAFLQTVMTRGVAAGTVIEIKVTQPDGSTITSNMRVQQSDLDLVEELKKLSMN